MKLKVLLILTLTSFVHTHAVYADCLACWKLQYVNITTMDHQETKGYIKWNEIWAADSDPHSSFFKRYLAAAQKFKWETLTVYDEVFELNETLNIPGLVTSEEWISKIELENVAQMELLDNERGPLTGAGGITDLRVESLTLLQEQPEYIYKVEGTVEVTYFMSYNSHFKKPDLIEISKTKDYWLRRKDYENKKVLIIIVSWD